MLTAAQNKRISEEAVKMASEIAEGQVPKLDPDSYCGCAAHELAARAGLISREMDFRRKQYICAMVARLQPDNGYGPYDNLLSNATVETADDKSCGALVFVLLDLACDLDPSALDEPRAAPSPTPNTRKERYAETLLVNVRGTMSMNGSALKMGGRAS